MSHSEGSGRPALRGSAFPLGSLNILFVASSDDWRVWSRFCCAGENVLNVGLDDVNTTS